MSFGHSLLFKKLQLKSKHLGLSVDIKYSMVKIMISLLMLE